jgi:hypothetical protein
MLVGEHINGPHFLDDLLTGLMYATILRDTLPALSEVLIDSRRTIWYHQDEFPAFIRV